MAEWNDIDTSEKLDPAFAAIRSLFLDGSIDTMYKLIHHNPTKIARLLSMSYKTLITKLQEPWKFSTMQILLLAYTTRIDPEIINNIIQKESEKAVKTKHRSFKEKEKKLKENAVKGTDKPSKS